MTIPEVISIAGMVIIGLGLVGTIWRNGRHQAKRDGRLEERIDTMHKTVGQVSTKTDDIKKIVVDQGTYCAGFTARIDQRVISLEKRAKSRGK